jgi:hypothetical protein
MSKPSTQVITDLCMAINAVEGTEVAPEYQKQNERVRQTLYDLMIDKAFVLATTPIAENRVSFKRLDKAIKAAGWDDQHFERFLSEGTWGAVGVRIVAD